MNKVKFNIGYQYLGPEDGLLPFIDIIYIDEDGNEYDALENVVLHKKQNNQLFMTEAEKSVFRLIEKSDIGGTVLSCSGIMPEGWNYSAPQGCYQNPVIEIPNRVKISDKYLYNLDISPQDKCGIISKMYVSMFYNAQKKKSIGFERKDDDSFDFEFFYGNIDIKELANFSTDLQAMLFNMIVSHHNRRSKKILEELDAKQL